MKPKELRELTELLPHRWRAEAFDASDAAPADYAVDALPRERSCDGTDGFDEDDVGFPPPIRGGADAESRGWGPGWPNCQSQKMVKIARDDGVTLPVHRDVAVLVGLLCDETERRGYDLVPGWCWGFACRSIRNSPRPSNHSWGLAVDLNAPTNPMGPTLKTDMPDWMVDLWEAFEFRWGGNYSGRKDAMHYEFLGTPEDAQRLTEKALQELKPNGDATGQEEAEMDYVQVKEDGTLFQLVGEKRVRIDGAQQLDFLKKSAKVVVLPKAHRVWQLFPEKKDA